MPKIIQTPSDRFNHLPDYPFSPNYLEVEPGLKMHYVEEGNKNAPIILLLHGEPSWSYLYRKMIPILVAHGFRVIAPDLIGFGKSDKFVDQEQYTYQKHLAWLHTFVKELKLFEINLFCQDWGGLLGLRMAADQPELFARIVASNTTLPTGQVELPEIMQQWQAFARNSPDFDIGQVINMGTINNLSAEVMAAYNAPFPSEAYKAAARVFPSLVPGKADEAEAINNQKAWQALSRFNKPFLTIFGDADLIMKGAEKYFHQLIPGTKGQDHEMIHAGHFIQEDKGEILAEAVARFISST